MTDQILTRHGHVSISLARATRFAIATLATPALIVLDDVHLRLSIAYTSAGVRARSEELTDDWVPQLARPTERWVQLMQELFEVGLNARPDPSWLDPDNTPIWAPCARGVRGELARAGEAERKALARLFGSAAGMLTAEQSRMQKRLNFAMTVRGPRPFPLVPTEAEKRLGVAGSIGMLMLRQSEGNKLGTLLPLPAVLVRWARTAHEDRTISLLEISDLL